MSQSPEKPKLPPQGGESLVAKPQLVPPKPIAQNGSGVATGVRAVAGRARMMVRHFTLLWGFGLAVVLPVALTALYLYIFAADQYASRFAFTTRSEEVTSPIDVLGGLGRSLGTGTGGASDGDILYEYIRSQDMVKAVDARVDLREMFSRNTGEDPLLGYDPDGTVEDLTDYWQRMVRVSYDGGSGLMDVRVLAFEAADAQMIAMAIEQESTRLVNDLAAVAREDATRYARDDLELAVERLKAAREAMTAFRIENQIVDVSADIQGQMGVLATLQSQQVEALINMDLLAGSTGPDDPRVIQAQRRIDVIEARIEEEKRKFGSAVSGGSGNSYAAVVAEFERLTVDREFAETAYTAALASFDGAVAEANRRNRYLAAYVKPTLAEKAEYPQRELLTGLVAMFSFLIWAITSLVYYALRDRR